MTLIVAVASEATSSLDTVVAVVAREKPPSLDAVVAVVAVRTVPDESTATRCLHCKSSNLSRSTEHLQRTVAAPARTVRVGSHVAVVAADARSQANF